MQSHSDITNYWYRNRETRRNLTQPDKLCVFVNVDAITSPSPSNAINWSLCSEWLRTVTQRTAQVHCGLDVLSHWPNDQSVYSQHYEQNEIGRTLREPKFYIAPLLRITFVASFETYISHLHSRPSMLNNDESFMGGGDFVSLKWCLWTEWHRDRFFSEHFGFPSLVVITAMRQSIFIHLISPLQSSVIDNATKYK